MMEICEELASQRLLGSLIFPDQLKKIPAGCKLAGIFYGSVNVKSR
jgi:hypothetical protein